MCLNLVEYYNPIDQRRQDCTLTRIDKDNDWISLNLDLRTEKK